MTNKAVLVGQREFLENVRTKAFWISILLFPVIFGLAIGIPIWLEKNKSTREYAVVDQSGWLLEAINQRAALPDLQAVFRHAYDLHQSGADLASLPNELRQAVQQIEPAIDKLRGRFGDLPNSEIEDKIIEGLAASISGLSGPRGEALRKMLPPDVAAATEQMRDAIRTWWLALPPDEAKTFGSVTKERYIQIPFDQLPDIDTRDPAMFEQLNRKVADEDLFAYFVIPPDPVNEGDLRYVSANLTDEDLRAWFRNLASSAVRERRLEIKEIDAEVANWIQRPLDVDAKKIGSGGEEAEVEAQDFIRQWAPAAFVYLLWVSVFSIVQMLLTNTVEEKSNRIMEVLLSSVSPLQLMIGKIGGIAFTGLTMVLSWLAFMAIGVKAIPLLIGEPLEFDLSAVATDPVYIGSFVVYFLLGYLFYASLLVAVGSVCNSLKEAQNLQTPVTLVLMIPLFMLIPIAKDPNGSLAQIMSYVPPFTPFVMMNRAAGPPSTLEYLTTTLLLIASVIFLMWAAAKVFRIGILMTGKPPRISEILRWVRAPVGVVPERRDMGDTD